MNSHNNKKIESFFSEASLDTIFSPLLLSKWTEKEEASFVVGAKSFHYYLFHSHHTELLLSSDHFFKLSPASLVPHNSITNE